MEKKHIVKLTKRQRDIAHAVVEQLKGSPRKVKRAQILLKADSRHGGWADSEIADAFSCTVNTVENVRRRFCEYGFEITLNGKQRENPPRERILDGDSEAAVIALRLSEPPEGYANWTLSLLQERVVALSIVDQVSRETLRRTLKKNKMTRRKIQYWVIPPKQNAQFAANMENVLGIYKRPYDKRFPVICMDEQPVQLLEEVNIPIAATKNHARRLDYEYKRNGTVSVFMFCEPLAGWRGVSVRPRRTKTDWAVEVRNHLTGHYAGAEKVTLVCDNLNTHVTGAFYEAFEAHEARSLLDRLDLQFTPKHGSWLNIAENELSSMTRQAMHGHRFATIGALKKQLSAWAKKTNDNQRGVDWQFTVEEARTKLKHLYPKVKN